MNPCNFFKCLADETRLKSLLLIAQSEEACVCELMGALGLDQPKISRHLAQLRDCDVVIGERRGKWVFYKLHPNLPTWAREVIDQAAAHNLAYIKSPLRRLQAAQAAASACH